MIYEDKLGFTRVSSLVADKHEFWWNDRKHDQTSLWESKIYLGEQFFNEIISHPVPLDMNILKALKRSSLGIDFYLWLTYYGSLGRASIGQFRGIPANAGDNRTVDYFRTDCLRELKKIKMAWPDLNYATTQGVLILLPAKPVISPNGRWPPRSAEVTPT